MGAFAILALLLGVTQVTTASARATTFSYTGSPQTFLVPGATTSVAVSAVGASGGANAGSSAQGGRGATVFGQLSVTPGQTLYVYVGGNGGNGSSGLATQPGGPGGFNGGGDGGTSVYTNHGYPRAGGGGGGASDVRTATSLASRLIVAAGGGGGGANLGSGVPWSGFGGAGGNASANGNYGLDASAVITCYGGGSGDSGGAPGTFVGDQDYPDNGEPGALGQGGSGGSARLAASGGGGGGGLFGGGGGAGCDAGGAGGGGGGSSLVPPHGGTSSFVSSARVTIVPVGPPTSLQLSLDPSRIKADGVSSTLAEVQLDDASGNYVAGAPVALESSDPGVSIGGVTDLGNGRYVARITSSATPRNVTITASSGDLHQSTQLTQLGPPNHLQLHLSAESMPADGSSSVDLTVEVRDSNGSLVDGQLAFESSDHGQQFGAVTRTSSYAYTVPIRASTTAEAATITVRERSAEPDLVQTVSLTQTRLPPAKVTLIHSLSALASGNEVVPLKAYVSDTLNHLLSGESVVFSSTDPGDEIGPVIDLGDGTYTADLRVSGTVGRATVTATVAAPTKPDPSDSRSLEHLAGPATEVSVSASPTTAQSGDVVTVTARVTDDYGHALAGRDVRVEGAGSGPDQLTDKADGSYTGKLTVYGYGPKTITVTVWFAGPSGTAVVDLRDASPPWVVMTTPAPTWASFLQGQTVAVEYTCEDSESGVATCSGTVPNGSALDTSTPGEHIFSVTAADRAGNVKTTSVVYQVTPSRTTPASQPTSLTPQPLRRSAVTAAKAKLRTASALASKYGKTWRRGRKRQLRCTTTRRNEYRCSIAWDYRNRHRSGTSRVWVASGGAIRVHLRIKLQPRSR